MTSAAAMAASAGVDPELPCGSAKERRAAGLVVLRPGVVDRVVEPQRQLDGVGPVAEAG